MNLKNFWHNISNVRPIVWIMVYVGFVPIFALLYWLLPAEEFRIPDGGSTGYGGCLYYSIVTITTLGFGDYTPAGAGAQCITAIEVMFGLITIGFFLNAVGAMKSEIAVESELEKQRRIHVINETGKLLKNTPICMHKLNVFLEYCYAVTTPLSDRATNLKYNPKFTEQDMRDMEKPSGLPDDRSDRPAIRSLLQCADSTCLFLDSLQARIDLTIWPELLEECFAFVANFQMLTPLKDGGSNSKELMQFIRNDASLAISIQRHLTSIAASATPSETSPQTNSEAHN